MALGRPGQALRNATSKLLQASRSVSIYLARGLALPRLYGRNCRIFSGRKNEMKHLRIPLVTLLTLTLTCWLSVVSLAAVGPTVQSQSTALERGYRTGYSDGYNAGFKDVADRAARDYHSKEEYQRADRSYNEAWGTLESYRDGYQQGFEAGYTSGYDRQLFNSSIPTGLTRRSTQDTIANPQSNTQSSTPNNDTADTVGSSSSSSNPTMGGSVLISPGALLMIELESSLSTDASQRGDRFQARVIEPSEYQGAVIEGRVTRVKRPGKVKGVAELQLSFDQIRMPDNRTSNFRAEIVEVGDMGNGEVGGVDPEGGVRGRSSTKDDVSRVGAATGIGAIIGAIAGGGKGAAIGAAIGGAAGTGSVLSKRGKDLRLDRGQQLRIRTAAETRIQ
jgi:hypothetical protein